MLRAAQGPDYHCPVNTDGNNMNSRNQTIGNIYGNICASHSFKTLSFTISLNAHNHHVRSIIILKKLYNFPKVSQYTPL